MDTKNLKRPWFLTAWLIFIFLVQLVSLLGLVFGGEYVFQYFPNAPVWLIPVFAVALFLDLVSVVLLWMWRIIGLYLSIVTTIFGVVLTLVDLSDFTSALMSILTLAILYLMMRPVWSNFK